MPLSIIIIIICISISSSISISSDFILLSDTPLRFKVDSGFKGADGVAASSSGGKPVQFEREKEGDKDDVSGVAAAVRRL